jgi:hypothetical protein
MCSMYFDLGAASYWAGQLATEEGSCIQYYLDLGCALDGLLPAGRHC